MRTEQPAYGELDPRYIAGARWSLEIGRYDGIKEIAAKTPLRVGHEVDGDKVCSVLALLQHRAGLPPELDLVEVHTSARSGAARGPRGATAIDCCLRVRFPTREAATAAPGLRGDSGLVRELGGMGNGASEGKLLLLEVSVDDVSSR